MLTANAYQAFTRQIWEAIIEHAKTSEMQRCMKQPR